MAYTKEQRHEQYLRDRDKYFTDHAKLTRKLYRQNNRDKILIRNKKYYQKNLLKEKLYAAEYYKNNKEKILKANKKWHEENKDKHQAINKSWLNNNRERSNKAQRKWRAKNVDKAKGIRLKTNYGITLADYNKLMTEQNFCCAGCGKSVQDIKNKRLNVDHCHTSGKVRGLLCFNCNSLLGHAKDNIETLKSLIRYLTLLKTNEL